MHTPTHLRVEHLQTPLRIESEDCVLVPWPDETLTSRQQVGWRVKVWADGSESEWSSPAWFEMGLLDPADRTASWIEPVETARAAHVLGG
jgi:alpha-L-rhamnosidase